MLRGIPSGLIQRAKAQARAREEKLDEHHAHSERGGKPMVTRYRLYRLCGYSMIAALVAVLVTR